MIRNNPNKSQHTFVFDCPSCNAKHSTFDVKGWANPIKRSDGNIIFELFSVCRSCKMSIVVAASINDDIKNSAIFNIADKGTKSNAALIDSMQKILAENERDLALYFSNFEYFPVIPTGLLPPEHIPENLKNIFNEATKCFSLSCYNASGAMFRLCLDITTKHLLETNQHLDPSSNDRRSIHNRLTWIFNHKVLPRGLEDLSRCIKDDGNDAAHDGNLGKIEAEDLLDFTYELLNNVYTQPERIKISKSRREQRKASSS